MANQQSVHASVTAAVTLVTTAETVIAVSPATPTSPSIKNVISGHINITTGTATTAIVVRVRQGSTTGGTLVGAAETHTVGAAVSASVPFGVEDTSSTGGPINAANNDVYCVTIVQTSATGNGTATGEISVVLNS